jgi:SAM-dependent methyltransferase
MTRYSKLSAARDACKRTFCKFFKRLDRKWAWPETKFLIENVPSEIWGDVVGDSFTNWVYQQGFFAALMRCHAPSKSLRIVDFGCGHGKMAPISVFFTEPDGEYVGIDIQEGYIDYCRRKYARLPRVKFHLSGDSNPFYPTQQGVSGRNQSYGEDWPVAAESVDILIAISVFTHLQEADAFGYMNKIYTVLKPGGLAIFTCHIVEEPRRPPGFIFDYEPMLASLLRFDTSLPGSRNWFTCCAELPESGIAMNMAGLNSLMQGKFKTELILRGSGTGGSDPTPQDVVVARKMEL